MVKGHVFYSLSFLAEAKDTEYRWCVSAGTDSLLLYAVVLYSIMCGGLDMMCTLSLRVKTLTL